MQLFFCHPELFKKIVGHHSGSHLLIVDLCHHMVGDCKAVAFLMRDILKQYHVESFQGYYYAKPLLIGDFLEWEKNFR